MKILCEFCDDTFDSILDEVSLDDIGGVRLSFSCPTCDRVYPVARITSEGLTIRAKLQQTTDRFEADKLRQRLREEMVDERRQ
jgi:transcriptional regulator NrdR family protein